jgi:hypothetical protein
VCDNITATRRNSKIGNAGSNFVSSADVGRTPPPHIAFTTTVSLSRYSDQPTILRSLITYLSTSYIMVLPISSRSHRLRLPWPGFVCVSPNFQSFPQSIFTLLLSQVISIVISLPRFPSSLSLRHYHYPPRHWLALDFGIILPHFTIHHLARLKTLLVLGLVSLESDFGSCILSHIFSGVRSSTNGVVTYQS